MATAVRRRLGAPATRTLFMCAAALMLVAGAQLHVHGSEAADAEEMPVIGGDTAASVGGIHMPPPEPEDEQGGHDGEDDEGDEKYIRHPDDDEEALLKQALEGDDGLNSKQELFEDDESEDRYQPMYERDEDERGAEGQDESDGMQAILQSERAYFIARDHDGDGELSKEEFIRQLNNLYDDEGGAGVWDSWNVSARGRPAPSDQELMWGKDWTARVSSDQAEEAFVEYDVDKDGKVSWAEWQGIMFHEDHQVPEFRDGHDFDAVVDPLGDDDIDPDELEMIKNRFIKFDGDKDGSLSLDELVRLIVWTHDEPEFPDGVMNYTRPSDGDIRDAAHQLLKDYDRDHNQMLTMEEWIQGGGF